MSTMNVELTGSPGTTQAPQIGSLPQSQQLGVNPQLPQSPMGAYTDSQYLSDNAVLKQQIAQQYQDILQQLGYVDPNTGQFIQGSVATNANRQLSDLSHSRDAADVQVLGQAQNNGTLFSGIRGYNQAQAEYPYTNQMAQLQADTPVSLQQLYEQAGNLISGYQAQNMQQLAAAAQRRAQALANDPTALVGTPGTFNNPGAVGSPVIDWGNGQPIPGAAWQAPTDPNVGHNVIDPATVPHDTMPASVPSTWSLNPPQVNKAAATAVSNAVRPGFQLG